MYLEQMSQTKSIFLQLLYQNRISKLYLIKEEINLILIQGQSPFYLKDWGI